MISIREIKEEELAQVKTWWEKSGRRDLDYRLLPIETTFVAVVKDVPVVAVTLLETNGQLMWVECLIGNPDCDRAIRQEATRFLSSFIDSYSQNSGFSRMFCMSPNDKLTEYYESLGYKKRLKVDVMIKEI